MDISVPVTIQKPGTTVRMPWGDVTAPATEESVTLVLHIDEVAQAAVASLVITQAASPAALSAQDLANVYSSAELIAAFQLAVKAGK